MKLSKKCRYGLRALIDMAVNTGNEQVVLSSLAERNHISAQYLEQIFSGLRRAEIVKGTKGSQGGYRLNRHPSEITVAEILEALDGSYRIEDEEVPEDHHGCGITASIQEMVIDKVNDQLDKVLKNITLEDLKKNYSEYSEYGQDMYYI